MYLADEIRRPLTAPAASSFSPQNNLTNPISVGDGMLPGVKNAVTAAASSDRSSNFERKTVVSAYLEQPVHIYKRRNTAGVVDGMDANESDLSRRHTISTTTGKEDPKGKARMTPEEKRRAYARPAGDKGAREIDKNHSKFLLMYNMLSGIRITVSRCESKPDRDLTPNDYTAAHKMASDIAGGELEPNQQYDFKFKDYSPFVFRKIRSYFGLSYLDYLNSLTGKYVLSELDSPGKSGSFFYFSYDYRFIIKTIHATEHELLRKILPQYLEHVKKYPNTLLARFYGLHRVKAPGKKPLHFVVMTNVFPSNKDIHEIYDLKGSTVGRAISDEEAKDNPKAVMKDLNWLSRGRKLELGPEKRRIFIEQLEKDVEFLSKLHIMDYSLLVGIHDLKRGNQENLRDTMLSVFEPNRDTLSRNNTGHKRVSRVDTLKQALKESNPIALGPSSSKLPEDIFKERKQCIFYAEEGGLRSTDEQNYPTDELYYIGIIDILTPYNFTKQFEHLFKSITQDKLGISAVRPSVYGKRFLEFMKNIMKVIDKR